MDPKHPPYAIQAAAPAASGSSVTATAPRAVRTSPPVPRSPRSRPELTLLKPAVAQNTPSNSPLDTALTPMPPGADAETVQVLERLHALCPALEFPFGARRFDAEAFYALETPDDNRSYELIDGVVVVSPSVLPRHSFFTFNLFVALYMVTRERGMGPIFSEVDVTPNPRNVVRPDLMWYGDLPTDDETLSQRLVGLIPWVVVETLSPRTQRYDQTEKRIKYQQMGVIEYWILHPKQKWLEVHIFPTTQGGKGRVTRLKAATDVLTTALIPDWSLSMGDLFDPKFNPNAERMDALRKENDDQRQGFLDTMEDARVRLEQVKAQAEGLARQERELRQLEVERRVQAEGLARQERELRQLEVVRRAQAEGLARQERELRQLEVERRAQAEAQAREEVERRMQAEALLEQERQLRQRERDEATRQQLEAHAIAAARDAQFLARLERLERSLQLSPDEPVGRQ